MSGPHKAAQVLNPCPDLVGRACQGAGLLAVTAQWGQPEASEQTSAPAVCPLGHPGHRAVGLPVPDQWTGHSGVIPSEPFREKSELRRVCVAGQGPV